jgi:hypothetical protein
MKEMIVFLRQRRFRKRFEFFSNFLYASIMKKKRVEQRERVREREISFETTSSCRTRIDDNDDNENEESDAIVFGKSIILVRIIKGTHPE